MTQTEFHKFKFVKDVSGDYYIEPIEEECIVTQDGDPSHYTLDTASSR